jgi:3-oxoacyl-[acyl-carrier protein] reductase
LNDISNRFVCSASYTNLAIFGAMDLDLLGKNALVCGSTQGIGKATAQALAKMGATVFLLARNEEKLQKVKSELDASKGQKHDYLCADFSDVNSVRDVALELENKDIHILINNTGGPAGGPITSAQSDDFEKAFKMHVVCNQILSQAVVESMKKACFGRIVNVISTSVKVPINGLGVSNTIRGAVASWAKTMANELGQYGVTVNNVLPGFTNTNRLKTLIGKKAQNQKVSEEEIVNTMLSSIPASRFGEADEVANAIAFLCSPAAAYINGINVPVDGGRTGTL